MTVLERDRTQKRKTRRKPGRKTEKEMKITINRKHGNVRFGSRAWAVSLPADGWTWEIARYGDESRRVDIYNGKLKVASLGIYEFAYGEEGVRAVPVANIEHGGAAIGFALLCDLRNWINTAIDLSADDKCALTITSK